MFTHKNAAGIRGIQDALECCGFRSLKDQAWPFKDKEHDVDACIKAYGRTKNCEGLRGRERKVVLGWMVVIAAGGLVCKVSS